MRKVFAFVILLFFVAPGVALACADGSDDSRSQPAPAVMAPPSEPPPVAEPAPDDPPAAAPPVETLPFAAPPIEAPPVIAPPVGAPPAVSPAPEAPPESTEPDDPGPRPTPLPNPPPPLPPPPSSTLPVVPPACPPNPHGNPARVAVDTNTLITAIEAGGQAVVDAALRGRAPVISPQALSEFLVKGDFIELSSWMAKRGGSYGASPSVACLTELQTAASKLSRSFKPGDLRVAGSAMTDGLELITRDSSLKSLLVGIGHAATLF